MSISVLKANLVHHFTFKVSILGILFSTSCGVLRVNCFNYRVCVKKSTKRTDIFVLNLAFFTYVEMQNLLQNKAQNKIATKCNLNKRSSTILSFIEKDVETA
jgi:hypothetical protein